MEIKRFFFTIFVILIVGTPSFFPRLAFAQKEEVEECQNYYQFGEVKVNLNTKKAVYFPDEEVKLSGVIVNQNTFPLLDITVFAHLKRVNRETFLENGHFLVERLVLAKGLNFLPKEEKHFKATFKIKKNYPAGEYQLQYFIFSNQGFYYSGRPFLEEDFAGMTNFKIKDTSPPLVFFDLNSLRLNGQLQKIRDYIPIFDPQENPLIEVDLQDLREAKSDLLITYKWYRWDDTFEENLLKTGRVIIFADQPPTFQTVFDLPKPGAYVLLLALNDPVRSLFKFRIARRGEKAYRLRANDLGVTNYPVDPQKDRAFVCFHSPSEEDSPQTRVTLSLLDKRGQVLRQKSVEDSFTGEVVALSIPLTGVSDPFNFSIEANFEDLDNPSYSQRIRRDFNPEVFGRSLVDLKADFEPNGVGGPKLKLKTVNLLGGEVADQPLERLVIYRDGEIVDEQYNLGQVPKSYDLSNLSPGNYKLVLKSGSVEKRVDFKIGQEKGRRWWLLVLGMVFAILVAWVFFLKRRREKLFSQEGKEKENEG